MYLELWESLNPDAWKWYYDVVGQGQCNIDTWWQTRQAGFASTAAPATATKPGSATLPMPGIVPIIFDTQDRVLRGPGEGVSALHNHGLVTRTVWGDHNRFVNTISLPTRAITSQVMDAVATRMDTTGLPDELTMS